MYKLPYCVSLLAFNDWNSLELGPSFSSFHAVHSIIHLTSYMASDTIAMLETRNACFNLAFFYMVQIPVCIVFLHIRSVWLHTGCMKWNQTHYLPSPNCSLFKCPLLSCLCQHVILILLPWPHRPRYTYSYIQNFVHFAFTATNSGRITDTSLWTSGSCGKKKVVHSV